MAPEFYASEVFAGYVGHHVGASHLQPWHRPFLSAPPPAGRILDVGCGGGALMKAAGELGFDPWGIDLDQRSVESARRLVGSDQARVMDLNTFVDYARTRDLKFDVVSFFEVLEHQDDPHRFLAQVRSLLRPGGQVVGSVPNRDRLGAEVERRSDHGDLPPHHFFWFSERSLRGLLSGNGIVDVAIRRSQASTAEVSAWVEARLAGRLSAVLKSKVKAVVLGNEMRHVGVGGLRAGGSRRHELLSGLRRVRDVAFYPAGLAARGAYNNRGAHLYFSGRSAG